MVISTTEKQSTKVEYATNVECACLLQNIMECGNISKNEVQVSIETKMGEPTFKSMMKTKLLTLSQKKITMTNDKDQMQCMKMKKLLHDKMITGKKILSN